MSLLPKVASVSLAIGVGCGAFGAHGLRDVISPTDLAIWDKAVLYQLVHSLGALVLAVAYQPAGMNRRITAITRLLLTSTAIFSGSLYLLVLLQQRWLGAVTPLGGAGFIVAWLLLALHVGAPPRNNAT